MTHQIARLVRGFSASAAGLTLFTLASSGAAQAQTSDGLPACAAFPAGDAAYACHCAPDAAGGSVWGSDPYTGDSDLCTAAIHAGVVGPEGGPVRALPAPGQPAYQGSSRNGIVTSDWGSYGYSFTFRAPEMNDLSTRVPACTGFPSDAASLTCACPAGSGTGGSVWGSGPYTRDSDLCTAARHDGVIGAEGGTVTALAVAGLGAYRGSESNGVATASWGGFDGSFVFDHNGN